jgi:hypothetical protein
MYKPLPDEVEIRDSEIHGKGLFAKFIIDKGKNLGMTHYQAPELENGLCRTPLGGFINHSDTPNCELIGVGKSKYLITLKDIMPDEEITLKYSLYKIDK